MIPYRVRPDAPLTPWQRRERFAMIRKAQRQAYALRGEVPVIDHAARQLTRTPSRNTVLEEGRSFLSEARAECIEEARQWEHLAMWLSRSVHPAGGAA